MAEHDPTLIELRRIPVHNLVRQAIKQLLEIPESFEVEGIDFIDWQTQVHNQELFIVTKDLVGMLSSFEENIIQTILSASESEIPSLEKRFKKFNAKVTKLPQESVENIWDALSTYFRNAIYNANDLNEKENILPIFSLEECLKKGKIQKFARNGEVIEVTPHEQKKIRQKALDNLKNANDQARLLERIRNNIFGYFQQSYGMYKSTEGNAELSTK